MQVSGNFQLLLSLLVAVYWFKLTLLQKMPGGEADVGYAWAIIFSRAIFLVCMALVAFIIGFGSCFAWHFGPD